MSEQCYVAQCADDVGSDDGVRYGIVLSNSPSNEYPEFILFPCIVSSCVSGGSHSLVAVTREQFDEFMSDEDDFEGDFTRTSESE